LPVLAAFDAALAERAAEGSQTIWHMPDMDRLKPSSSCPVGGERVKEGERERRFDALVEAYSADVVSYCAWRSGSASDTEDAVAEVLLTAWRRLDDVPAGDAARAWLYATARRVLANQRRSTRRRAALAERLALTAPPEAPTPDPEEQLVWKALGRLGPTTARSCCYPNGRVSHPCRSPRSCSVRR
jgi:hypothetical protein